MGKVLEKKVSPTRKRIDARVRYTSLFAPNLEVTLRIVSGEEIPEGKEAGLFDQVRDRRSEWRPGKQSHLLRLNGINATAYILEFEEEEL